MNDLPAQKVLIEPKARRKSRLNKSDRTDTKSEVINPISSRGWMFIPAAALITLGLFLLLDPEKDLLLAICSACNMGILLWMLFKLYEWDLLLSPVSILILGNGAILNYTIGNLGARMAGEARYAAMPGSLEFYPQIAFLSMVGLSLFSLTMFGFLGKWFRKVRVRYQDMYWRPQQVLFVVLFTLGILFYLSSKYQFDSGYFIGVSEQFDRWLSASNHFFIRFSVIISVSILMKDRSIPGKLIGIIAIVLIMVVTIGLRSRTFMVEIAALIALCWITLDPKRVRTIVLVTCISALIVFLLGTFVKYMNSFSGSGSTIIQNINLLLTPDIRTFTQANQASFSLDTEYRMAGFELPAAILRGFDLGVPPMLGEGMLGGVRQGLPNCIRPTGTYSERSSIFLHFVGRGLVHDEAISIPLASGLADWGFLLSPLIYILIALFCLLLWRVAQLSSRLFLAYLITGAGVGDLFWQSAFLAVRLIAFAWIFLLIFGFILMPKVIVLNGKTQTNNELNGEQLYQPLPVGSPVPKNRFLK